MKTQQISIDVKTLLLGTIMFLNFHSFSQTNTLPTTGNIGIGTLTPSSKLDVNGNAVIDSCLLIKDSLMVNKTIRTMGKMFVEQKMTMKGNAIVQQNIRVNGNSRVDGNLRTFGNSRIEGLLKLPNINTLPNGLYSSGNYNLLTLKGNGTTAKLSYDSLAKQLGGDIYDPVPYYSKCTGLTVINNPQWSNGPNKLFSLCPQVNVGIGNDSPRVQLDVIGGTGIYARRLTLGDIDPVASTSDFQMKTYHSTVLHPDRMLFNVENPDRKLFTIYNSGLIRAREIKVDLAVWPDYVFDKNYELMPLKQVEKYILKNGHLPNVPNTQEVVEEGVNLGEMNRILLEKIEELTLHLIEQEKRINELETK